MDFHWLCGKRVKVNSLSPASSRLSATARHFKRHYERPLKLDVACASYG